MRPMMGTDDILTRLEALLEAGEIQKKDIAEAIGIAPQRIADLFTGKRKLKLDEGQRLVEVFGFEDPAEMVSAIATTPVLMMGVRYVLQELCPGVVPEQSRIEDIAKDLRAFLRYAARPPVRDNIDMAAGFFLARKEMEQEAQPAAS
jgi:transcriptional regulator with XRE-family HTH domain